jgi:hypothetical protein
MSNAAATQPTPPPSLRRSRGAKEARPAVHRKLAARRPTPGTHTQVSKPNNDNPFSAMFGNNQ